MQSYVAQDILEQLDAGSLKNAQQVYNRFQTSCLWREAISGADLWQTIYNKNLLFENKLSAQVLFCIILNSIV